MQKNEQNFQPYEDFKKLAKISDIYNRSLGCIFGAFLGDSMGSVLEFDQKFTEQKIKNAILLIGGGIFQLAPGQITDDSEMALSLAHGLISTPYVLNLGEIIKFYRRWFDSNPFDIGQTTEKALKGLKYNEEDPKNLEKLYLQAKTNAIKNNAKSLSNGALMRITPLAIWCHRMSDIEDIEMAVTLENGLTHSNEIVHKANTVYVLAINELINNKGDYEIARKKIKKFIRSKKEDNIWKEIYQWYKESKGDKENLIASSPNEGYLKIAWIYAFSAFFNKETDFISTIKEILKRGGDTDTNACICGGLVGASIGFDKLPKDLVIKLINCQQHFQKRPEIFHPIRLLEIFPKLMKYAPETLFYLGVKLEIRLSDSEEIYKRLKSLVDQSKTKDKLVGCLFGSLYFEKTNEKIQKKNLYQKEETKDDFLKIQQDSTIFDLIMKILYKLTAENDPQTTMEKWFKSFCKKERNSHDILITMIPLTLTAFLWEKNYMNFLKKLMNEENFKEKGIKEACLSYCYILGSLFEKIKPENVYSNFLNYLEKEGSSNEDFNLIQAWLINSEMILAGAKENNVKTSMALIFDTLKQDNWDKLDLMKNVEHLSIEKYDSHSFCLYGSLMGAYQGFTKLSKEKIDLILKKQKPPRFNLNNLVYLISKLLSKN